MDNQLEKEFKVMIVKMVHGHRERMQVGFRKNT